MNILLALQEGELKRKFFSDALLGGLRSLGSLKENPYDRALTQEELAFMLRGTEVCIVLAWDGTPRFTKEVLEQAKQLKLIVSPGGSVASFITEDVYARGIKVCSANNIMARYVAEGALAYMQAGLRAIVLRHGEMQKGIWNNSAGRSLFEARIGLVGLGSVGKHLLELLRPFNVKIKLYDPYVSREVIAPYPHVTLCSLEEALSGQDIVSLHASKTAETYHMLDKSRLGLLQDGTILVNTARGALIDEAALIEELESQRIQAVLDVYEQEPLPLDSKLRQLENVTLMPHAAGMVELGKLSEAMVEEIRRFQRGEQLANSIPSAQFRLMTR
ncbi:MAG: hydroxyacid dehydrogenase [Paenibacillaceae bacterium]|jgi:phosphoglycerate dehydrogenase-like enzyme|nr:hydroxyacid dehydrogenase [Paenibacillaceae bacterium]